MDSFCVIAKRDCAGFAMTMFAQNQARSDHLLAAALDQIT
jgi:hypothetical protein